MTAIMTAEQVSAVAECLDAERRRRSCRSLPAASRIPAAIRFRIMRACMRALAVRPKAELLWASPRELLNIFQADEIGCHIITVTNDVLAKLSLIGKDLDEYSLETVQMFHRDATAAGFTIAVPERRAAS